MRNIKVLHLFDNYPGANSQNWLYKLITNTPYTSVYIAAERYTKHNLYSTDFSYFINPLDSFTAYKNSIPKKRKFLHKRIFFAVVKRLLGTYNSYLSDYINKINPEILHAHFAHVGYDSINIAVKHKIPLVVSFYGYDYEYIPYSQPEYKIKYKELFKVADKFICEGEHGKSILINMGCPAYKIEVIHLGVELGTVLPQIKTRTLNELKLLQIANIVEKKGHIYTVKAFHKALQDCPGMHLTIVGNGLAEIKNELITYISDNNLIEKVTLINEIDYRTLYSFMNKFDVFIHPSCYSKEMDCEGGAPVVLLDAQAAGLPVISTTHCDIPDEVINNVTGLLTPEKDIDALSLSIKKFYSMDNETYTKFSIAGRNHIEKNFDIQKNAVKNYDIYMSLLKHS